MYNRQVLMDGADSSGRILVRSGLEVEALTDDGWRKFASIDRGSIVFRSLKWDKTCRKRPKIPLSFAHDAENANFADSGELGSVLRQGLSKIAKKPVFRPWLTLVGMKANV